MISRSSVATGARVRARSASSLRGRPAPAACLLAQSLLQPGAENSRRAGAPTAVHAEATDARGDLECAD